VKMRREVGGAVEEYLDYLFPDDEKKMGELPLCCIECFIGVEASACLVVVVVVVVVSSSSDCCCYVKMLWWMFSGHEDPGEGLGMEENGGFDEWGFGWKFCERRGDID